MRATDRSWLLSALALFAIAFGVATVFAGARVLFGDEAARVEAGAYVPFVLWFNFLSGFVYLAIGAGLLRRRRWAACAAAALAAGITIVFVVFGFHIAAGGPFEARTVAAMTFRSVVWIVIAIVAQRRIGCPAGRREPDIAR